jgi:hypothetical protein
MEVKIHHKMPIGLITIKRLKTSFGILQLLENLKKNVLMHRPVAKDCHLCVSKEVVSEKG